MQNFQTTFSSTFEHIAAVLSPDCPPFTLVLFIGLRTCLTYDGPIGGAAYEMCYQVILTKVTTTDRQAYIIHENPY